MNPHPSVGINSGTPGNVQINNYMNNCPLSCCNMNAVPHRMPHQPPGPESNIMWRMNESSTLNNEYRPQHHQQPAYPVRPPYYQYPAMDSSYFSQQQQYPSARLNFSNHSIDNFPQQPYLSSMRPSVNNQIINNGYGIPEKPLWHTPSSFQQQQKPQQPSYIAPNLGLQNLPVPRPLLPYRFGPTMDEGMVRVTQEISSSTNNVEPQQRIPIVADNIPFDSKFPVKEPKKRQARKTTKQNKKQENVGNTSSAGQMKEEFVKQPKKRQTKRSKIQENINIGTSGEVINEMMDTFIKTEYNTSKNFNDAKSEETKIQKAVKRRYKRKAPQVNEVQENPKALVNVYFKSPEFIVPDDLDQINVDPLFNVPQTLIDIDEFLYPEAPSNVNNQQRVGYNVQPGFSLRNTVVKEEVEQPLLTFASALPAIDHLLGNGDRANVISIDDSDDEKENNVQ